MLSTCLTQIWSCVRQVLTLQYSLTSDYLPVCQPLNCGITVAMPNCPQCDNLFLNSKPFTEPNTLLTVLLVSSGWGNKYWLQATMNSVTLLNVFLLYYSLHHLHTFPIHAHITLQTISITHHSQCPRNVFVPTATRQWTTSYSTAKYLTRKEIN